MITAAMATMATVDTRLCYPCGLSVKTYAASAVQRVMGLLARAGTSRTGAQTGAQRPQTP
jgi:hypothetical protein